MEVFFGSVENVEMKLKEWGRDGRFRIGEVYEVLILWKRIIWENFSIFKYRVVLWLVMRNGLVIIDNMCRRGWVMFNRCVLCCYVVESRDYSFFEC